MTAGSGSAPPRSDLPDPRLGRHPGVGARARLAVSALVGLVVAAGVSQVTPWRYAVLFGWLAAGLVFVVWMWLSIWPMDAPTTARHAVREDPGRAAADTAVVVAAVVSLFAVGLMLTGGASGPGGKDGQAALSVVSVALAWTAVHTIFTTRYARLYYTGPDGGIDFNEDQPPCYPDFAYLAFTIGMTFQVSDTDLQTKAVRVTVLTHALLSYVFGVGVIATTINLVAGLGH
ncbi:MAG: hypothetical protein JWN35_414 [Frankiales bacterium]|jgi:uncharacterized membrane protein|nr:hypothetical protein [Frankiales bacterium]